MVFAQQISAQTKSFPLSLSVFNEATALPYTRFFTTPVHPGIQASTEFVYKEWQQGRLIQSAGLNYFYHHQLNQGLGLFTELGYEYRIPSGFAFTGWLGIGYMHTFATEEEFTFSEGGYQRKPDGGNARFFPSFSLDIGYYMNKVDASGPKLFLKYQSWVEYPYSPGFIPLMTHINLHVGVKFHILKHSVKK